MPRDIRDMICVISGASAGIGKALAQELDRRGAKLVLAARRLERLEELNAAMGGRHLIVRADVAHQVDCELIVERAIEHYRRIDTLICNAGYGLAKPVAETSAEEMREIFQTNVFGTTDLIRAAVPHLARQDPSGGYRGQIIIVSSAAGRRGLPYFGPYSATKAAQLSLAEALRVELAPAKIAVTSVHPIGTSTDFFTTAETLSHAKIPPRTAVEPRQTAETVARKIAAAIERPRPELWPHRPMRWALNLAVLFPALADRIMANHRKALADQNGTP